MFGFESGLGYATSFLTSHGNALRLLGLSAKELFQTHIKHGKLAIVCQCYRQ